MRNIPLQSLQILWAIVSRAEIVTIFEPKIVKISERNINMIQKLTNLQGYIFNIIAIKLCFLLIHYVAFRCGD